MTEATKPTLDELKEIAKEIGLKHPSNIGRDVLEFKIGEEKENIERRAQAVAEAKEKSTQSILEGDPAKTEDLNAAPTSPQKTRGVKLKMASVKIKKTISRKKKLKEVWLVTPYFIQCTDEKTGTILIDDDGDELAIPLLVCTTVPDARKLIIKYQPKVDVDEDGDLLTVVTYQKATQEQIDAFNEEMAIRAKFRAITIRQRKVRDAKHIVQVTPEEAGALGK